MEARTDTKSKSETAPVWVAFDFDGTLTRRDTLLPFLRQVLGTKKLAISLLMELPWLAAYFGGALSNDKAKERLLRRTLGGVSSEELHEHGRQFAEHTIPKLLRAGMLRRLSQHLSLGHQCVLVTASPAIYTRPWAQAMGFAHVIATELAFDTDGNSTGYFLGGNCYGPIKAARLREIMPAAVTLYAYGDSRGDRELLAVAQHGWLLSASNRYGDELPIL
ncbi:MAG: HAD-IB family hydrolase [Gammaproteobacteria bacterium]|jgi:phosphatidylglycerophosphatase C